MSHIQSVDTELRSAELLERSCEMLGHQYLGMGIHAVYNRDVRGLGFKLAGWVQPCVADVETGKVTLDNSQGNWGDMAVFNGLKQRYGVEAAKEAITKRHLPFREATLSDNRIVLEIDIPDRVEQVVTL